MKTSSRLKDFEILLAEDSLDNQVLIKMFLDAHGARVDLANNGFQALEKATEKAYDIVLMDIQMPELGGDEATQKLRDRGYGGPIVALTAHDSPSEKAKTKAAGCDAHLTKPLDWDKLLNAIETYARRQL